MLRIYWKKNYIVKVIWYESRWILQKFNYFSGKEQNCWLFFKHNCTAYPLTAAIVGFLAAAMLSHLSKKLDFTLSEKVLFIISLISAPAANAFSLPVIMIAPTFSSASCLLMASLISRANLLHRAFRAFGRFSVMRPTFFFSPVFSDLINS